MKNVLIVFDNHVSIYSDSATDSSIDLYDGKASKRSKVGAAWSHHIANRDRISSNANFDKSYGREQRTTAYQSGSSGEGRVSESDCDIDKKYPDLLDISRMSMQTSVATSSRAQFYTQSTTNTSTSISNKSAPSNPFCTFPRKKHISNRKATPSESQSPLLNETSSQYGSSTFADSDLFGRRLSSESFSNYPLSICTRNNQSSNGRSNSFLNLTSQSNSVGKPPNTNTNYLNQKRNPSLPASPMKEPLKLIGADETPLLDFTSLAMHKQQMILTPSSSTSNTTANAYDYHAAQLERFLEEYRNLQEQLCKMKETCESIRKKEAPLRATAGNSVKVADPVMFTALNNPSVSGSLSFGETPPNNPKGILKNKILLPNQPPDPPPYWLHRNAMLKRLQDPNSDFFPS